jgi:hypothetical protein
LLVCFSQPIVSAQWRPNQEAGSNSCLGNMLVVGGVVGSGGVRERHLNGHEAMMTRASGNENGRMEWENVRSGVRARRGDYTNACQLSIGSGIRFLPLNGHEWVL